MTSGWIVEPLDVVEHIGPGLVPCAIGFARRALDLQRREEAPSIAALSQTFPARLMLQTMPLSASSRWNGSLVY